VAERSISWNYEKNGTLRINQLQPTVYAAKPVVAWAGEAGVGASVALRGHRQNRERNYVSIVSTSK
jgi:hypothetical protein